LNFPYLIKTIFFLYTVLIQSIRGNPNKKSFKKTLLSDLFISTLFLGANAMSADYKQNPFTLTYDGAITENVQGKVNIQPVKYQLNGLTIAANVYTPANFDSSKKYPAIVVAHPNGGVKEQVAGLYGQKLAGTR